MELNENELKVLKVLDEITDTWGERCIAFDYIEEEAKLTRKEVQKACKTLREKELVQFHRGLMTEDGEVAGSGYCISSLGKALLNPCDKCNDECHFDWWQNSKGEMTYDGAPDSIRIRLCEKHYQESKT